MRRRLRPRTRQSSSRTASPGASPAAALLSDAEDDDREEEPTQREKDTESEEEIEKEEEGEEEEISLWRCFVGELTLSERAAEERRMERLVDNMPGFVRVLVYVEKLALLGVWICLDALMHMVVMLPLRAIAGLMYFMYTPNSKGPKPLQPLIMLSLLIGACLITSCWFDVSSVYHEVKAQSVLKLYVIINTLEIFDKLFSALSQDTIFNLEHHISTWTSFQTTRQVLVASAAAFLCLSFHVVVLLFQVIALMVAINTRSTSLMTILISNQFMEIKSSVFKRVDPASLFQITCSDLRERFQLMLVLAIIAIRSMAELQWDAVAFQAVFWKLAIVYISELLVDTVKHSFIIRFNGQSTDAYRAAERVLALDVAGKASSTGGTANGQKPLSRPDRLDRLQRRLGFAPLPFVCLIWNFVSNMWPNVAYKTWIYVYLVTIVGLLPFKIVLRWTLEKYARWRLRRLPADLCQPPATEQPLQSQPPLESQGDLARRASQARNVDPYGVVLGPSDRFGRGKRPHLPMEEVDRFTMTSRII